MIKKVNLILFLLIAVALSFSTNTKAQLLPEFGIKGGVNFSTVNNLDGTDYKPGVLAGVFVKLKATTSPISFQPELLYVQYGGADANSDATQTFNYIQLPILLKFGFDVPAAPISPNVYFGPYLGLNINAELDDGSGNTSDITDLVNNTDSGIVLGAGVDIDKFRIGLRYTVGLKDIYIETVSEGEKHGAFALTVGLGF